MGVYFSWLVLLQKQPDGRPGSVVGVTLQTKSANPERRGPNHNQPVNHKVHCVPTHRLRFVALVVGGRPSGNRAKTGSGAEAGEPEMQRGRIVKTCAR